MQCTASKAENPPKAEFCSQCGAPLTPRCSACTELVTPGLRFCIACGYALTSATAPAKEPAHSTEEEGERRHAAVVLSDLSGYTGFNERLDPEEVEAIMGRMKREAVAIIERHGEPVRYLP